MDPLDRIIEEFKDLNRYPISDCGITTALRDDNNYRKWISSLLGPRDSSYKKGLFYFYTEFPEKYPSEAPKIYFNTPIYHVNVNPKVPKSPNDKPLGSINLSTLNMWKPEYTMREVFMNIFYYIFYLPSLECSWGNDIAEEFRNNRAVYEEKTKYFTKKYANPMKVKINYDETKDWNFNI